MINRLKLSLCVFTLLFLAACAGSKGGSGSYDDDDDEGGGGGGGKRSGQAAAPKADDIKKVRAEATQITEENHKLAREVFELKNKLGEE
ncbi:MAG: hypothetical protein FWF67_06275 [Fibromonadales bacterium]|nr:hypothetical protein [Fibromonadales bacterium]